MLKIQAYEICTELRCQVHRSLCSRLPRPTSTSALQAARDSRRVQKRLSLVCNTNMTALGKNGIAQALLSKMFSLTHTS